MNTDPDDPEITELAALDAQKISAVSTPANGTPWLLLKSAAPADDDDDDDEIAFAPRVPKVVAHAVAAVNARSSEAQSTQRRKHAVKPKKAARQAAVRHQHLSAALKSRATSRTLRIAALERLVKSAPADVGATYLLSRELLKAGREDDQLRALGLPPLDQAAAIAAASAPAIATATGTAINAERQSIDQRGALRALWRGTLTPESLPGQTELPSLVQIHRLEKQLRDAATPQERERIGYQLTRLNLIRAHRLGEI